MDMPEYVAVKIMPDKKGTSYNLEVVTDADFVDVVRCKDCKHYELDSWAKVNGIPLIVANHICKRWGEGCKTDENGFCFMGEKVTE